MQFLRANTAVDVLIGPFVEDGDGDSPLTALTLDVELSKLGQALADSESSAPTHDAAGTVDGYYNCVLGTTDTDTEGTLTLVVHHAEALPIRHDYMVLAESAWDSMFVAKDTGFMDVNIKAWADTAVTLGNSLPDVNIDSIDDTAIAGIATDGKLHARNDAGGTIQAAADAALVANNLDHLVIATGAVETDGGNSTTQVKTDLAEATNDHYNGMMILFTSGDEAGEARLIDDYVGASGTVSWIKATIGIPADDVTFVLLPNSRVDVASWLGTAVTLGNSAPDVNLASEDNIDWGATKKASINTEVDGALDTSISELGVAAPTATPTVRTALMLLYMALRNKTVVQTSGTDALEIYNDAGTKITQKLLTDDGSDYTEAEMG